MRPSERKDRVLADLLVIGISELATPEGTSAKTGSDTGRLRLVEDAAVASRDGTIVFVGTSDEARRVVELTEGQSKMAKMQSEGKLRTVNFTASVCGA